MALFTVPLVITTVVAVRYIQKRNEARRQGGPQGHPSTPLDTTVVAATIVLSSLPDTTFERTLKALPPEMARSMALVMTELPGVAPQTISMETRRWMNHFTPPLANLDGLESIEASRLAAATIKMVLEDSA